MALLKMGCELVGRELRGHFTRYTFSEKVALIAEDLQMLEKDGVPRVIANSMGAYLYLHAQAEMPAYSGKVLLLSPIVGAFSNEEIGIGFVPPKSKRLFEIAKAGLYPAPKRCEIHVGSEDWQCNPMNVSAFGSLTGIPVTVIPNNGHMLDREYVTEVLGRFLF